jgi:hypothetical protein
MTWGSRWVRRRACIRCSGRPGRIFGGSVGKSEHDTTRRCGAWRRQSRSDRASHGPRGSRRYSRKVSQQARTHGDLCTRLGTVTCADGLMWTGSRWMACKRSGVRIPIAPPQLRCIIRNPEPRSSGAWYSTKVPQRQRYEVPYIHSDKAPPLARAAGTALPWPGAQAPQGLLTRQNAHFSLPVTLARCQRAALSAPLRRGFCG